MQSVREYYPIYPLSLRTPSKSKTRLGTRDIYVDVPWQAYDFLISTLFKGISSELKKEEVRKNWHKYIQDYKESLTFQDKPIVSIYLTSSSLSKRKFLILKVNWEVFFRYLEDKAKNLINAVKTDGKNVMIVYQEIWFNFLKIIKEIRSLKPLRLEYFIENFKKLIIITEDYNQVKNILKDFERLINEMEDYLIKKSKYIQLYTIRFKMSLKTVYNLMEELNIVAIYYILRNLLEDLIRFFIYFDLGNKVVRYPDLVLSSMFIYDYKAPLNLSIKNSRIYSLKNFRNEFRKKFLKATNKILSRNEVISIFDITDELINIKMRRLGVDKNLLKDFCVEYDLECTNLVNLYNACSSIIHNQSPLPFFSLLEVKFFKYFLKIFMETLKNLIIKFLSLL